MSKNQPRAEEAAPATQQIRIAALKNWSTGIYNETQVPIMSLETFEGQVMNVHMTPEAAIEIGEALIRTGQQTKKN